MTSSILVVDDEADIRMTLSMLLMAAGYEVHGVEDGEAALDTLSSHSYDLVLLDLMLPWVGGLEVLQRLPERARDTPVVVISAMGEEDAMQECLSLGAASFVAKPFTNQAVVQAVAQTMAGSSS